MRKLDDEMRRTDALLYQMIPKAVADRLRKGEPAMNTCQVKIVQYTGVKKRTIGTVAK